MQNQVMSSIVNKIEINGPLADVFDLVTTTRYWPQWHPATIGVSGVTERPFRLGDQVQERAQIGVQACLWVSGPKRNGQSSRKGSTTLNRYIQTKKEFIIMQRFRHLFIIVLGGIAVFALAACQLTIQPPTTAVADQTPPLRNELLSRVDLVGFPELFTAPQDATPDPDGQIVYFTAAGLDSPGLFRVPAAGGETTAVATGAPFVAPQGLASSMDGTQIYVADPEAANADGSLGQLFVVPAAGGEPMPLAGAAGSAPRGVEVSSENGADVIYFSGLDPADGQPAVMKIDATGSELSIIAKDTPLVDPVGLAVTKAGVVYVADQMASGNGLGSVFQIENGTVTTIADQFRTGNPVGATLTLDESVLLVSAMAPDRDSAQVLVIELASGQQGIINKVIEANPGSGGVHRAHNVNVFAWADSTAGNPRRGGNNNRGSGESGGVYALEP